jgi:hypothetical protein
VTSRDAILAAVRANQPTPSPLLPQIPSFATAAGSLLDHFQEALLRMGGKFVARQSSEDLDSFVRALYLRRW